MMRRSVDTTRLDPTSTNVVASPMARLFDTALVTANAEHSPSVCTSTGFSCHNPRVATLLAVNGPVDAGALIMLTGSSPAARREGFSRARVECPIHPGQTV